MGKRNLKEDMMRRIVNGFNHFVPIYCLFGGFFMLDLRAFLSSILNPQSLFQALPSTLVLRPSLPN